MNKQIHLVLILGIAVSGCVSIGADSSTSPVSNNHSVTVTEVVDGDTVDVLYNGREERIRLIGIDTPEVHVENDPAEFEGVPENEEGEQCLKKWGKNASNYVKKRIDGKNANLQYNLENRNPERDSYGRILGEIFYNNSSINRQLVLQGYARSYSAEGPFIAEEDQAQENQKGLWKCRNPS